jgi:hypothetical protein
MKYIAIIIIICAAAGLKAQLPTDAIAHFQMDGTAEDVTTYRNDGSMIGGVSTTDDRHGNPCGALMFDGSTGYLSVPSSPSLKRPLNAITVTVWVKMEANATTPSRKWLTVCCKSNLKDETIHSPQFRVQSMQDDAYGYNTVSINTDFTEPAQENLLLGQWFFYALRYDGNQVMAFINGNEAFRFAYTKAMNANDLPLEIGRDTPGGMEFFCGSMDDLRIWDRALTDGELKAVYNDASGQGKAAPVVIKCPPDVQVTALPGKCDIPVNYNVPTASVDCGDAQVVLVSGLATESRFPIGESVVTYEARSTAGNIAQCSFKVRVMDQDKPTVQCPADIRKQADPQKNSAVVNYADATFTDNCPGVNLQRIAGGASGSAFPIGANTVTFQATDAGGQTAVCSFLVTVDKSPELGLKCSKDIVMPADPNDCSAVVAFRKATLTGDFPDAAVAQVEGNPSGSRFAVGSETIRFSAAESGGRTAECSFKVRVEDMEPPTVNCPHDVNLNAPYGSNGMTFHYEPAGFSDNCPGSTIARVSGPASGDKFPLGTTSITYQVRDAAGNTAQCSFAVTVVEAQPDLPRRMSGDTVVYQKEAIPVGSRNVRVYYYDNHDQDGDTISLNYDGRWVVDHVKIHSRRKVLDNNDFVDIVVEPGQIHYLVSKAWNEGKKPTNTLTIEIVDGVSPARVYDLTSTIGKSSAVQLYYKK